MWKGRDAVSLVSSQPRYSRLGWRTHNTPKINMCVCVCACVSSYALSLWSGWDQVVAPFKLVICFWINLQQAIGRRAWTDKERGSVKARGLTATLGGEEEEEEEEEERGWRRVKGGGGDAVGLFKTPCLWEDLLSLRPVTMETGPAQCRGEGRGARGRYHGNTSCHGNSSDGGGRAGSRSFKETGAPSISWWRVLFFSHTRTSCFIYLTRKSHDGDALDKTIGSREEGQ